MASGVAMTFWKLFRPSARAVVERGPSRLEVEGDEAFVERMVERFLGDDKEPRAKLAPTKRAPPRPALASAPSGPAAAPRLVRKAPKPQPMEAENTVPDPGPAVQQLRDLPTVSGVRSWRKKRKIIRLHAMDGGLSKVYPLDPRRMKNSILRGVVDLANVQNIYVEEGAISEHMKGDQKTVWHALVPHAPN